MFCGADILNLIYFPGIGTVINVLAIILGGIIGLIGGKFFTEKIRKTLQMSCAISVIFIGISGTLSKMFQVEDGILKTDGEILLIISLIFGGLIGEIINIDKKFKNFGEFLKKKSGNNDDKTFVNAFVTASFTVCIGAMAIIGAINDAIFKDVTILIAKSSLDLIIILVMTAGLGKGCIFSCISVGIFQGAITFFAGFIEPLMTEIALKNLSCVGNVLIFCVGINLMFENKICVANLLPAMIISIFWR
ncbi:MAG: DUF554 domain-containing protein [Selenomonadaceae bacterium]|nr:DUF554 domain-containing protein [Selenomonadaceae bacterium]